MNNISIIDLRNSSQNQNDEIPSKQGAAVYQTPERAKAREDFDIRLQRRIGGISSFWAEKSAFEGNLKAHFI